MLSAISFKNKTALRNEIKNIPRGEIRFVYFNSQSFEDTLIQLGYTLTVSQKRSIQNIKLPSECALGLAVVGRGAVFSDRPEVGGTDIKDTSPCHRGSIELCKLVLSRIREFQKQSGERDSYGYKHDIEQKFKVYIQNGAFIQAGLELRLQPKWYNGINAGFYFSDAVFQEALTSVVDMMRTYAQKLR